MDQKTQTLYQMKDDVDGNLMVEAFFEKIKKSDME